MTRCAAAVRSLDATAPIRIETVRGRIEESLVQERLITVIAAFLGAVSLLLACGALGGLMSHMVASRTSEMGLRIALGAEPRAVTALVMREALMLAGSGAIAGMGLALAGGRFVATFLNDLPPSDPVCGRRRGRGHAAHGDGDRLPARSPRRPGGSDRSAARRVILRRRLRFTPSRAAAPQKTSRMVRSGDAGSGPIDSSGPSSSCSRSPPSATQGFASSATLSWISPRRAPLRPASSPAKTSTGQKMGTISSSTCRRSRRSWCP